MRYININILTFQQTREESRIITTRVQQTINSQRPSIEKGIGTKYETNTENQQI